MLRLKPKYLLCAGVALIVLGIAIVAMPASVKIKFTSLKLRLGLINEGQALCESARIEYSDIMSRADYEKVNVFALDKLDKVTRDAVDHSMGYYVLGCDK